MVKKGLIILLLVLIAGVAALIWFVEKNGKSIVTDPFTVIPPEACLIIESVDLAEFLNSVTESNRLFPLLETIKETGKYCEKIRYLRNIASRKEAREIFERNRVIISYQMVSRGRFAMLISMNLMQISRYRQLLELLKSAGGKELAEARTAGLNITPVIFKTAGSVDTLFFTFRSGLAICGTSPVLLRTAVLHRNEENDIRHIPGFTRIMSSAGRKEDKIYIVFTNLAEVIRYITSPEASDLGNKFSKLAGCACADVHLNENGLILSGFTESADSGNILFRYKSGVAGKLTSYEILPSDVIMFETILLKDKSANPGEARNKDGTAYSFAESLAPYIDNEVTRAILSFGEDQLTPEGVVIYKISNRQVAEQVLADRCKGRYYYQPDDQTKIPVYIFPSTNIADAFPGEGVPKEEDSLYAFSDNYLVSANSFNAIKKILYDNILNKTLINDLAYRDFESSLPSKAAFYFYCQPSAMAHYLSSLVNDTIARFLLSNAPFLKKINAAGYQFAASNDMIYNTFSLRFSDTTKEASGAEWETMLDTSASVKPFFFTNHNTGAREIFIQDFKNNVYLINSAGRVLWKVSPGERILGNVYMIDYYNNGKYQLLFAGRNSLCLLDRNGNYVERFPVKLRSPASGPPALFDYDGTGDFRILVPGEDRQIYAYDKTGSVVRGWKPFRTGGIVKSEIKFFRISGKDYLVAADDQTIYFLDRTGNQRLRLRDPVLKAMRSEIRLDNSGFPGIVFTSPEGVVNRVSFDGTVSKTVLGKFSVDHSFDFFDVDGDGFGEYVFIDKGILYLYNRNGTKLFEKNFGSVYLEGPVFFVFSASDRKIGVTDTGRKLIYLVDKRGNIANGFPLKGASVFSIGKLSDKGDFRLIVGGENNFLYNYRIETSN